MLLPAYDTEYITVMNRIYNNPPRYKETRRHGKQQTAEVPFPQLNILAGIQPGWMATAFPPEAWSSGLTSRTIMIYAADGPLLSLLAPPVPRGPLRQQMLQQLEQLAGMWGPVRWDPPDPSRVVRVAHGSRPADSTAFQTGKLHPAAGRSTLSSCVWCPGWRERASFRSSPRT